MTMSENFFSKLTKFVNIFELLKISIMDFLKTYPIRKSKIFGTIKCVLRSGTCPLRDIKMNALKQPHIFVELRLCHIY